MRCSKARTACLVVGLAALAMLTLLPERPVPADGGAAEPVVLADRFLSTLPKPSGLCVHLGVRDGALAVGLANEGQNLVHGLAIGQADVDRAREKIEAAGLAGVVSVEAGTPAQLPYADSLVNLLVADQLTEWLEQGFRVQEALRVLQPDGVAWLGQAGESTLSEDELRKLITQAGVDKDQVEIVRSDGLWARIRKPRPQTLDEWTHIRRDASDNPVSTDRQVGVPTGIRWVTGPNWPTGNRKASVPGAVISENRLVYVFEDEGAIEDDGDIRIQNTLIARDPFNGLPLWKRRTANGPAKLVCVEDRVYTVVEDGGPLVALAADTGEIVKTYEQFEEPDQIAWLDGRLLVASDDGLSCVDAESGDLQWQEQMRLKKFVAGDGRVFAHADQTRRGGDSEVLCLELDSGRILWRQETDKWADGSWELVLYNDGILLGAGRRGNYGVDAANGKLLWSYEYPLIGHGGSYSKVLSLGGLAWVHAAAFEGNKQYAWEGLDPKTGKVVKRVAQPDGFRLKHRCSFDVATERYFLCGSMEFADLETGTYETFDAARKSCRLAGSIPANGLLYTFPHACGCYPMLRGFLGLATEEVPTSAEVLSEGKRLVKGPAFGKAIPATETRPDDWPMHRHDARRTGSTNAKGPTDLEPLWSVEVTAEVPAAWSAEWNQKDGGRLSSPVVAGGLAFVAAVDQHRLLALDAQTGQQRWDFVAGGRLDCPPSIHNGLCLLGSRDGWIYCLRAADGELVWKFQAAPDSRRIVAYGQLESPWPVVGGVLVYDGLAYFTVGRHSGSDGGVFVGALEPETGRLVWAERPEKYPGVVDLLNGDDGTVQMASWEFDAKTGKHGEAKNTRLQGGRLGMLNDAWYKRPIAMRKNLQLWTTEDGPTGDASGQMVAFNEQAACVFHACKSVAGGDGKMSGDASLSGELKNGREWSATMPLGVQLHAMALTPERLYVAGLLSDEKSGQLPRPAVQVHTLENGKRQGRVALDGAPVHDGLVVAGERVYVATQNGKLVCLGEK